MAAYTGGAGIPAYPDYGEVARSMIAASERQEALRAEAIRWQGAQEYDTLIKSGVKPQDAFSRVAPKLFYNDPRALAGSAPNIGEQPGRFYTDPDTGQTFIIQPNQRIQPVKPPWQGSTRVVGPNNQIYNLPLTPGQRQAAPTVSVPPTAPQVIPMPGGGPGQMIVQPGGAGRPYQDPTKIVKIYDKDTGTYVQMTTAEHALKLAREAAQPLLEEYARNKGQVQTEVMGWDWWPGNITYKKRQEDIEATLKAQGLDPEGNPIPGSRLSQQMGLETTEAAPDVTAQPATTAPATTAPTAPAPAPALSPRAQQQLRMWQRRQAMGGGGAAAGPAPWSVNVIGGAPPVTQSTAPAMPPPTAPAPGPTPPPQRTPRPDVPLGPSEVLLETNYGWAIYDKNLKKFVEYADQRAAR